MRRAVISTLIAVAIGCGGVGVALRAHAKSPSDDHQRIVKFWTKARVARAIPRDFVRDPKTGRFSLKGGRFDTGFVTGASWTLKGKVQTTTGKVLFQMGTQYYFCSANVVSDSSGTRSLISTAAHCVYDEVSGEFASNWMFVPDYDSQPVSLTGSGSFCDDTKFGCWTALGKIVSHSYATAGAFNEQAVLSDYAFVAVGLGGKTNSLSQLDVTVGSQSIVFTTADVETNTWSFGYPAAGRYKGKDLVYCNGLLYLDIRMEYKTYQLGCNMTGGSSGGPWFKDFSDTDTGGTLGQGMQFSVNSYGYNGSKNMYGPIFNNETEAMHANAGTMTGDTVYTAP